MKILALSALLVIAPLPLAAADCVGPACVFESSYSDTPCSSPGGYEYGTTTASVEGVGQVSGSWYCYVDSESGSSSSSNSISVATPGPSVMWSETDGTCSIFVYRGEDVETHPCPASPPNPGWGSLLS